MATYGKSVDFLIAGLIDSSGNPLSGGKVETKAGGTTTDKTTWTDRGKATPAANPVILDSYGKAAIFADGVYKFVVKDSADSTLFTLDNLEFRSSDNEILSQDCSEIYAADSASTDAYTITIAPAISAYATGMVFNFKANTINTGAATLAVNGLTAKTIKKNYNKDLEDGDIQASQIVTVIYDGTYFQMLSQVGKFAPSFSVHKNGTNQTITTGTWTKLTWATELFDTNSNFASNAFTPTVAGKYLLSAKTEIKIPVDATQLTVAIYKNGAVLHSGPTASSGGSTELGASVTAVVDANGSTDYFEIYCAHNSGSSKDVDGTAIYTFFTGCRVA